MFDVTREDQKRIARELLDSLGKIIESNLDSIPADWNGIELRQWMVDAVKDNFELGKNHPSRMTGKRKRAYTNAVYSNDLTRERHNWTPASDATIELVRDLQGFVDVSDVRHLWAKKGEQAALMAVLKRSHTFLASKR